MKRRTIPDSVIEDILRSAGSSRELAARFGVSPGTVKLAKRLKTKKAQRALERVRSRGETPRLWSALRPRYRFSAEQVASIRAAAGTSTALADEYGCSASLIRMIRLGKAYRQ